MPESTRKQIVLRYLLRFALLTIGFALTTLGLMTWQARGLSFDGLWPMEGPFAVHPLHLLVLGLAMIPPTLWEIFVLEQQRAPRKGSADRPRNEASAPR
ncbi:MAG: hypothetical protein AAGI15_04990 [Pseudomonadota bacterium]